MDLKFDFRSKKKKKKNIEQQNCFHIIPLSNELVISVEQLDGKGDITVSKNLCF